MWQSKNPKWVKGTRDSFASEPVIHSYRISNTLAINQVYKVPTSLWCQRVVTQTNNSCAMYTNCSENALIWVHFLFSAALLKSGQTWTLIQIYIFFWSNIHSMYNHQYSIVGLLYSVLLFKCVCCSRLLQFQRGNLSYSPPALHFLFVVTSAVVLNLSFYLLLLSCHCILSLAL